MRKTDKHASPINAPVNSACRQFVTVLQSACTVDSNIEQTRWSLPLSTCRLNWIQNNFVSAISSISFHCSARDIQDVLTEWRLAPRVNCVTHEGFGSQWRLHGCTVFAPRAVGASTRKRHSSRPTTVNFQKLTWCQLIFHAVYGIRMYRLNHPRSAARRCDSDVLGRGTELRKLVSSLRRLSTASRNRSRSTEPGEPTESGPLDWTANRTISTACEDIVAKLVLMPYKLQRHKLGDDISYPHDHFCVFAYCWLHK